MTTEYSQMFDYQHSLEDLLLCSTEEVWKHLRGSKWFWVN